MLEPQRKVVIRAMATTTRRDALLRARQALGLTQAEVAERVGITQQHYSLIENGRRRPALDVALRIAATLDPDPRVLFAVALADPAPAESSRHSHRTGLRRSRRANLRTKGGRP